MRSQEEYGKKEKHAIRGEDRSAERCKASFFLCIYTSFIFLEILLLEMGQVYLPLSEYCERADHAPNRQDDDFGEKCWNNWQSAEDSLKVPKCEIFDPFFLHQ